MHMAVHVCCSCERCSELGKPLRLVSAEMDTSFEMLRAAQNARGAGIHHEEHRYRYRSVQPWTRTLKADLKVLCGINWANFYSEQAGMCAPPHMIMATQTLAGRGNSNHMELPQTVAQLQTEMLSSTSVQAHADTQNAQR